MTSYLAILDRWAIERYKETAQRPRVLYMDCALYTECLRELWPEAEAITGLVFHGIAVFPRFELQWWQISPPPIKFA